MFPKNAVDSKFALFEDFSVGPLESLLALLKSAKRIGVASSVLILIDVSRSCLESDTGIPPRKPRILSLFRSNASFGKRSEVSRRSQVTHRKWRKRNECLIVLELARGIEPPTCGLQK